MEKMLRYGKLSSEELQDSILNGLQVKNKEVLMSAKVSEDCSAIRCADTILVTTDPITAASKDSGKLAILISANDISACGGIPFGAMITIIAPPDKDVAHIKELMADIVSTANSLNIDIIGGHTEFSASVNRTIINCTMLGKAIYGYVSTSSAKAGDSIIISKYAGIEGTMILANDKADELADTLTECEFDSAKALIDSISVAKEGEIGAKLHVSAMHDITEGGVFGAVAEMCEAGGLGACIDIDSIPLLSITRKICDKLHLDPYRLISSGSMLMMTSEPNKLIDSLAEVGVKATVIGQITSDKNIIARRLDKTYNLSVTADELLKII